MEVQYFKTFIPVMAHLKFKVYKEYYELHEAVTMHTKIPKIKACNHEKHSISKWKFINTI